MKNCRDGRKEGRKEEGCVYLFSIRPPTLALLVSSLPRSLVGGSKKAAISKAVKVMIFSRPFEADGKKDGQRERERERERERDREREGGEVKEEEGKDNRGIWQSLFAL